MGHWRPNSYKQLSHGQLKEMQTWCWSNLVSGVAKRTISKYLTCAKGIYIVNLDVTWSCRQIKKEQGVKAC